MGILGDNHGRSGQDAAPNAPGGSSPSEPDNVRRWDGEKRGHYEVWYVTLNHLASQTGYWIRYTLESPQPGKGDPYAQLWFAHFDGRAPSKNFAINKKFPISEMTAESAPFSVSVGDARLQHAGAIGALEGNGHRVSWDLAWLPSDATHHQLPKPLYLRGGLADTTLLTPNVDIALRGRIEVDDRKLDLDGDPGGQTHLWGRKHAHEWAWGHCNAFEGRRGATLETFTATLKKRGHVLPPITLLCLYLDGKEYRWTELQHAALTRGRYDTARYAFRALGARVRLEGEYSCRPEDMIVAQYHDPDGDPSYCSNTEVADLRVTVFKRVGWAGRWREHARLLAPRSGHFEIGTRQRDPAVETDHVTVEA